MGNNLEIIGRLFELSKNKLEYSEFPKSCKEEYIFLANALNDSVNRLEHQFDESFRYALGNYKQSLKANKKYGWFHNPEKLVYIKMQINQLLYCIYGERHIDELKFNSKLGNKAYKDLIDQIDPTALMTELQKKKHAANCNKLAKEILEEIKKEENIKH